MARTARAQGSHARRRAWERYGINLRQADLDAIVDRIRANGADAWRVCRESGERTHWAVRHGHCWLYAVYDGRRGAICTLLPQAGLREHLGALPESAQAEVQNQIGGEPCPMPRP